jgi:hypothetical protein
MKRPSSSLLSRWDRAQWVGHRGGVVQKPAIHRSGARWSRWQWVGREPSAGAVEFVPGESALSGWGHAPAASKWYEPPEARDEAA